MDYLFKNHEAGHLLLGNRRKNHCSPHRLIMDFGLHEFTNHAQSGPLKVFTLMPDYPVQYLLYTIHSVNRLQIDLQGICISFLT